MPRNTNAANPNRLLGRFVDHARTGCQYDRDVIAAREAITRSGPGRAGLYGEAITRQEALRRVDDEQAKSLRATNVMSPDLIAVRAMAGNGAGPVVVEISAGEFMGSILFGVTVYHLLPGDRDRDYDASNAYHDLPELLAALRALNGGE